ncbi:MAG: alkaline phosphatase, partial [Myxococcota bacterium]
MSLRAGLFVLSLMGCRAWGEEPRLPQATDDWYRDGQAQLAEHLAVARRDRPAKNVILFIGDGMGVATVTAGRIFVGQSLGNSGEEHRLSFERFPHVALSKTYNDNAQTPDSAGTMSAMVTGVKTRQGVLSVGRSVPRGDCVAAQQQPAMTLAELAELAGMATGVVTTTRLTHATPGAVYAHAPERNWEDDTALPAGDDCLDIAAQLLAFPYGDGVDVALGGGRRHFLPASATDPEYPDQSGWRKDGRDLIEAWLKKPRSAVTFTQADFDAVDPQTVDHLLGLFEPSHMLYEVERSNEPSLEEMTRKAIAILSRRAPEAGYFLMV